MRKIEKPTSLNLAFSYILSLLFTMKYTLKEKLGYVKKHLEENVPLHEIERK